MSDSNLPSTQSIARAWIDGPGLPGPRHFTDEEPPHSTCWSCGWPDGSGFTIQRAHIVADCAGGSCDPLNFLILCSRCHMEQPDGASRRAQLLWLKRRLPSYVTTTLEALKALGALGCDLSENAEAITEVLVEARKTDTLGGEGGMLDAGRGSNYPSAILASMAWHFAESIIERLEERRANGRPESGSQMALTFFAPPK